jgi:2-keto-4-pentenoate hydratase/2-oxohepta-3-ene-1,7-dioic acid hydratase in catechol pathway
MKRLIPGLLIVGAVATALLHAQQGATAFKLGTFERQGNQFVGIVLRDSVVIDLSAAHAALATGSKLAAPSDMKDLIARYDSGVRDRIVEVVKSVEAAGSSRPAYVYDVKTIKILPPIMYPTSMLNVAVNYREHAVEMAVRDAGGKPPAPGAGPAPGAALPGTKSAPGIWERKADDTRWNPYMFIKLPSAIIAEGETIRLPPGRTQIDWECELGVVIGRRATQVPIARAQDFIFGYTLENDVSDRAGRGDTRHGSDWLIAKNHDTFAPMGPFIVPKEFVPNVQKLSIKFTLNGQLMQDANTSLMIHDVPEQVSFASHITTLRPGDVIATGSPAGVGSARNPPVFLKPGDLSVCTYESIGTLTNPVAGPATATASR